MEFLDLFGTKLLWENIKQYITEKISILTSGQDNQVLTFKNGKAEWDSVNVDNILVATSSKNGLMSSSDKEKIDSIEIDNIVTTNTELTIIESKLFNKPILFPYISKNENDKRSAKYSYDGIKFGMPVSNGCAAGLMVYNNDYSEYISHVAGFNMSNTKGSIDLSKVFTFYGGNYDSPIMLIFGNTKVSINNPDYTTCRDSLVYIRRIPANNETWINLLSLKSTIPVGNQLYFNFGNESGENNSANINFYYAGENSKNNYIGFGFANNNNLMRLDGYGILDVNGILALNKNGLLVYRPGSGWTGISNTLVGVGALDSQMVIRSSASNLLHYRANTAYSILDTYNLSSYTSFKICSSPSNISPTLYILLTTLPTSSNSSSDSLIILGIIGGYYSDKRSFVNITIGRRESLYMKGFCQLGGESYMDIGVNSSGLVYLICKNQYVAYNLELLTGYGVTLSYTGYTSNPASTSWTFLASTASTVCKFTSSGTFSGNASTASALSGYSMKTLSSQTHSGWTDNTTDNKIIPTMSMIAFWNGAYNSSGTSNLAYCNRGAFGTIVTKNAGDYAAASHSHTRISVFDDRTLDSTINKPNALPKGMSVMFRNNSGANSSRVWNTIVNMNGFEGASSSGAGYRHLFLFWDSEAYDGFFYRTGADSTWRDWVQVCTSATGTAAAAKKVSNNLIIKLNGGTTENTNLFTYNGSAAKTVNITASSIGAATSSHTHSYLPLSGGTCTGNVTAPNFIKGSDKRLKTNIEELKNRGYLQPKKYIKNGKEELGFIALEVQELYPECVTVSDTPELYLGLDYDSIIAIMAAQILELKNEIEMLKTKIN